MKRNNMFMLAFIITMALCAEVKRFWDYPAWPLVVEAITVVSLLLAVADCLISSFGEQVEMVDTLQPQVEWILIEQSLMKKAVEVRIHQVTQNLPQQNKPTEPTIAYTAQDEMDHLTKTKDQIEQLDLTVNKFNKYLSRTRGQAKVLVVLGRGLTLLSFVMFFGIIIFGSLVSKLGLSLDLMTVWAFVVILLTQYFEAIFENTRNTYKVQFEAMVKATKALRVSYESEVIHNNDYSTI